jgi:hypothetical protein
MFVTTIEKKFQYKNFFLYEKLNDGLCGMRSSNARDSNIRTV